MASKTTELRLYNRRFKLLLSVLITDASITGNIQGDMADSEDDSPAINAVMSILPRIPPAGDEVLSQVRQLHFINTHMRTVNNCSNIPSPSLA